MNENGSSPLEAVALLMLLVLPIAPSLGLYQHLSDSLAAESIARHGLRSAVLSKEKGEVPRQLSAVLESLAASWGKTLGGYELRCLSDCRDSDILSLEISIGSARAIQSAGLEPR
ncbi:MAG: hypothetical protein OSA22_03950 [Aquiluna sp.]|nr:hypothetical protein [Aquiluna sp.]